jgi:GTP-binding protein
MFFDRVQVRAVGGAGGNGCISFRREKYVPRGGPDGGDGGDGGSVIFRASSSVDSLSELHFHPLLRAERGEHGQGSDMHGKRGANKVVLVPCGTLVRDAETGAILADLVQEGEEFIAARGGKGGRGNARFVSSTRQAPRFAEKGEPGEEHAYLLELKLIADVGIVGVPNAGKSTLLASISAARPKIADYPFTTLTPHLGVVRLSGFRTMTFADIPGLIEGASEGKGLGHDFLRHIERTRLLLFLISLEDPDPAHTLAILEKELTAYSPLLAERPRVIAFNKADIPEFRKRYQALKEKFPEAHCISAATGMGTRRLLEHCWTVLSRTPTQTAFAERMKTEMEAQKDITYKPPFTIVAEGDRLRIVGERVERAVRMTDFENPEAVRHLQRMLQRLGVFDALKKLDLPPGQTLIIADQELEYSPDEN